MLKRRLMSFYDLKGRRTLNEKKQTLFPIMHTYDKQAWEGWLVSDKNTVILSFASLAP